MPLVTPETLYVYMWKGDRDNQCYLEASDEPAELAKDPPREVAIYKFVGKAKIKRDVKITVVPC